MVPICVRLLAFYHREHLGNKEAEIADVAGAIGEESWLHDHICLHEFNILALSLGCKPNGRDGT